MPLGRKDRETSVYIVDFGIARRYRNPQNGAHMPFLDGKLVVGTIRYVSLNTHLGIGTSFTFAKYSKLSEFIIFQSTDAARHQIPLHIPLSIACETCHGDTK